MRTVHWLAAILMVLLVACGPSGGVVEVGEAPARIDDAESSAPAAPVASERSERAEDDDAAQADDSPARPEDEAPVSSGAQGSGALRGEQVEFPHGPDAGEVGVLGVEADDILNVRAAPGADQPIVERLEPLRRGLAYTGRARAVSGSIWPEITGDGVAGWVNGRYVGLLGGTDDVTAAVVGDGGGIAAPTMQGLAERVVVRYGLAEGYRITWGPRRDPALGAEEQRRVVVSRGPVIGDVAEITLDVLDLFDDAVAAERLSIFARPRANGGFGLMSVERTLFCWRGGDDLCA
jgi:hypothetical protein